MKLDKDLFLAGMATLAGAFGREIDGAIQRTYYGILSSQLSAEEFERAVMLTCATEKFWPSPAVILSKVKADEDSRAALAFEHVGRIMAANGGYRFLPNATYHAEFDAPTRAAISAVGGLIEISNTSIERWPGLQRRFAAAYVASQQPKQPAIAAPQTDPKVKDLVSSTARALSSGRDRAVGRDP